jgi:hypothetical protein
MAAGFALLRERGKQLMALPMMPGVRGHALGIAGCSASFETDVSI